MEKARSTKTICGAEGQGKTCMAKAILPEPQFAAVYNENSVAEWLTRHIEWKGDRALRPSLLRRLARAVRESVHSTHPLYGGTSERTGRLSTSHLSSYVITGCPTAGSGEIRQPVWARSRHSTQMPGVTSGTAAGQPADDCWNKHRATFVKIQSIGGRAAATAIDLQRNSARRSCLPDPSQHLPARTRSVHAGQDRELRQREKTFTVGRWPADHEPPHTSP